MNSDIGLYILIAGITFLLTTIIFYIFMRARRKKENNSKEIEIQPSLTSTPSISKIEAHQVKNKLRTMDLEKEILSYAIRHLYEAQVEGKITEEERDLLAREYKDKMRKIKSAISRNESIVALHELESMQDDLINLFNERFDELNKKIEDLRVQVDIKPLKEISEVSKELKPIELTKKKKRKLSEKPTPTKTEAEKRIEKIREEIEKVLERLGQIEVET